MRSKRLSLPLGVGLAIVSALPSLGQTCSERANRHLLTPIQHTAQKVSNAKRDTLFSAVENGNLTLVKQLFDQGLSPYTKNEYGNSVLYWAAYRRNIAIVRFVLSRQTDQRKRARDAAEALQVAAAVSSIDIARLLIANGAQVNSRDDDGSTPLMSAAHDGNAEMVAFLLKQGAHPNAQDKHGDTALQVAATFRCTAAAKLLLAAGADPNLVDFEKSSPLVSAAITQDRELAQALLEHGAKPDLPGQGQTALYFAAEHGDLPMVRLLLEKGANPNGSFRSQATPLVALASEGGMVFAKMRAYAYGGVMAAAQKAQDLQKAEADDTAIAALLLAKDVDIEATGWQTGTPLQSAAQNGTTALAKLLLEHGANWKRKNQEGENALLIAARNGSPEIVRLLLARGADADATNPQGQTALMLVAAHGRAEIVRHLLDIRKGILHRTEESSPHPLQAEIKPEEMAIWKQWAADGDTDLVKALLEKGAKTDATDQAGQTALQIAEQANSAEVAVLLKQASAK